MAAKTVVRTWQSASGRRVSVAIYVRVATDEEHQPFSIEVQLHRLRKFIESQDGMVEVAAYSDECNGAKLEERAFAL